MSNSVLKVRDSVIPSVLAKHPWVLSTSLQKTIQPIPKDAVVDLLDSKQRFVGRGLFNPDSRIAVRIYAWQPDQQLDDNLFRARIRDAIALRQRRTIFSSQSPYVSRRMIFSEADRISGLIVDAYGPYLTIQITSSGLLARLPLVIDTLQEILSPEGMLLLIDAATAEREGIDARHDVVHGTVPTEGVILEENGIQFHADLLGGQKTGHYLDQRQNRLAAANWILDGSQVLDVCSYTGGFSCTIGKLRPNAKVIAVDSSQKALDLAAENAKLNQLTNVDFELNDFYAALEQRIDRGEQLDAIILDPPRMASARSQVQRALAAYHRLNYLAAQLLRPGGILITCSCSGRVTREDFRQMLLGVSKRAGRELQVLEQRGAADDHPTIINCPETDYLKCFVCKIF